jgi:hypothetical protein
MLGGGALLVHEAIASERAIGIDHPHPIHRRIDTVQAQSRRRWKRLDLEASASPGSYIAECGMDGAVRAP